MNYSKIVNLLPSSLINLGISVYNWKAYKTRQGKYYPFYRKLFKENMYLSRKDLEQEQAKRFKNLVAHAMKNSPYYKKLYNQLDFDICDIKNIKKLPIVSKEDLRSNINEVYTIDHKNALIGKTGGTTGKSLVVRFTSKNSHERFAMLDTFRGQFGYELGKKTAWFSGKKILKNSDLRKHRYWKTDYLYRVRYYSTFHIHKDNLKYYVEDLLKYQPEYIVGFPSTMYDLAKAGLEANLKMPQGVVKAILPTAETVTEELRKAIESFFNTKLYDQYASSEGAPFIFECKCGNKHLELQSGVFEVLDEQNNPTISGRLVVTSFTTYGTPLIRYDIGDSIELVPTESVCSCGNENPLVKEIHGRVDDFIYSKDIGKINLGNISNTVKDVNGLIQFQVVQNKLDSLDLLLVIDPVLFSKKEEDVFIANWRDRIGENMELRLKYVDDIPTERSGKTRLVKNNIKNLIK